ncbi:hypothetical protein COV06_04355 [Candidatus Uhrbacteria bacterium CG10_big_fil_rev_8_21_14_0_10_50_16]|uniref:Uncharacterized protein n=1 Tax=Candidatus Uhrbacteria bacterium CG10_big_fil_rev_8_21_14_0_10_50_16 TaxID=1975039 RepID=A0A2H0RLH5_9BACT|nr:MAG: hypothetical protein COV06_04355 [Candidatus Uhrbacteria bacterium CG10_big_fil_rev_8_21_14_0_10_50_16]
MLNWFQRSKQVILRVTTSLSVVALFLFVAPSVHAGSLSDAWNDPGLFLARMIAYLIDNLGEVIASLATLELKILQPILQYSDFISHPVVVMGWEIVRNLTNTALIVFMLIIAFGTMFGVKKVNWQQQIPKLLIAAIAINYSRIITGLFIDIGQVVMNAFVNALQQVGFANFFEMLKIREAYQLSDHPTGLAEAGTALTLLGTSIFALVQIIIVVIVLGVMIAVLLYRVVVLWVLIVLSPAAFGARAADGMLSKAGNYYSEWWGKLTAAVMIGPILAFFLWLSLAATGASDKGLAANFDTSLAEENQGIIQNKSSNTSHLLAYVIGIALLLAGLEMASGTAGQLGGFAAKAVSTGSGWSKKFAAAPVSLAGAATAKTARFGGRQVKKVGRSGVELATDQVKGRTADFRQYTRKRLDRFADRSILGGGLVGGAIGRRARGVSRKMGSMDDADRKRFQQEEAGFGADLSLEESMRYLEENRDSGSARTQARVAQLRGSVASNKDHMNTLLQGTPAQAGQARQMVKDSMQHFKDTGDDASVKKLEDRMKQDLRLGNVDASGMSSAMEKMTDRELKGLSEDNFSDANFRQAMASSGMLNRFFGGTADENARNQQGYSRSFIQGATRANANRALDGAETTRNQDEQDRIAALAPAAAREIPQQSNNTAHRLMNAHSAGTMGNTLSAGLNLQDIDLAEMRAAGGGTLDPVFENRLIDAIHEAMTSSKSVPMVQGLMEASRNAGAPQEQARAREMINFMSGANVAGLDIGTEIDADVASGAITGGSASAVRAHRALRNGAVGFGDMDQYGFDAARPPANQFGNETNRREFRTAIATNPSIITNINNRITANGGNNDVARSVAQTFDKQALNGLLESFEKARGGPQEEMYRGIIQQVGQVLQNQSQLIAEGDEIYDQVQQAQQHFRTRIRTQL